jgi:hypothetical protein
VALIQTLERVPILKETLRSNESAALLHSADLDEMEDVLNLLNAPSRTTARELRKADSSARVTTPRWTN